ncbi:MAG: hypothetical protein RRB22_08585 [Gammaproteobacteria bacterium]|nr:hypothetical protein [Gammaproteobacteria bacterium]
MDEIFAHKGDLFDGMKPEEKFDIIIAGLAWCLETMRGCIESNPLRYSAGGTKNNVSFCWKILRPDTHLAYVPATHVNNRLPEAGGHL